MAELPFRNVTPNRRARGYVLPLLLALMFMTSPVAAAEEAEKPALSPLARRVLTWLPEDTESVVAAQSLTMPAAKLSALPDPSAARPSQELFVEAMSARALGVLTDLDAKYLQPLAGRKIALALRGNRNFDWVSGSLPTHRSESCSVIVFEKSLGDAEKQLIDVLRAGAEKTRKIAGREVSVFPASRDMRRDRAWKWRGNLGIHLVLLDSETLLCATSDTYLAETLKRKDARPGRRAIPENLAVWKQIDTQAPAWMVWHSAAAVEKSGGQALIDGIAWTVTHDTLRAVYLPTGPVAERLERSARKIWNDPTLAVQPAVERLKDGTVIVSSSTKNLGPLDTFPLAFALYQLEAANCGLADE